MFVFMGNSLGLSCGSLRYSECCGCSTRCVPPVLKKLVVEAIITLTSSNFDKSSPMLNDGNGGSNTAEFKFGKCPGR